MAVEKKMKESFESYLTDLTDAEKELLLMTRSEREKKGGCTFESAGKLMQAGVDADSDMLIGIAYYYMAECYLGKEDKDKVNNCLMTCIKYLQSCGPYEYIARAYNMLGVIAQSQDNIAMAMEYYDDAIRYCEEYELDYVHAMVLSNVADSYYRLGQNDEALQYFEKAEDYFLREKQGIFFWNNLLLNVVGAMNCLVGLGRNEEVFSRGEQMEEVAEHIDGERRPELVLASARGTIAWLKGDMQKAYFYVKEAGRALNGTGILESYDNMLDYLNLLVRMKCYDELLEATDRLVKQMDNMQDSDFRLQLLKIRLQYCSEQMTAKQQSEEMQYFLKVYEIKRRLSGETALKSLGMRREFQKIKEKQYELKLQNKKLLRNSLHDVMTGLPNRAYLNQHAEESFEEAFHRQKALGVCLMDVDCFKQLNDRYGHVAGDKSLMAVAEVLKVINRKEDVFCARYGGDEFILLFYDRTREEMERILGEIRSMVGRLGIPNEDSWVDSNVSVSIGGICRIPGSADRLWDFLAAADETLYRIKREGRNGFQVTEIFDKSHE